MMRFPRVLRLVAAALSVIVLSAFTQARAGWESSYRDGKTAYEAGEYGKAVKLLREAISDKGEEKLRAIKTSGMFFEDYLPHFYLGLALLQRKEYKEAIDELNISESMKVIAKLRDIYIQLKQAKTSAETAMSTAAQPQVAEKPPAPVTPPQPKPATPEPGPPPKEPAKEPAREPAKEPVKEPPKAVPMGPAPALTQAINAAATDIAGAQKFAFDNAKYLDDTEKRRLDALATDIRGSQTAAAAGTKHQDLQRTVAELRAKAGERKKEEEIRLAEKKKEEDALLARMAQNRALSDAVKKATPVLQEADGFLSDNRPNLPPSDAQRIQGLLESTKKSTSPDAVTKGAAELKAAVTAARRTLDAKRASGAREAQAQYARGVQAYFEGRYDEALPALQQAGSGLPREAGVKAFLGCAYYKKYLLTKETDSSLKQQAEESFLGALAADRGFTLDAHYFPPKVIAFYKEVAAKR